MVVSGERLKNARKINKVTSVFITDIAVAGHKWLEEVETSVSQWYTQWAVKKGLCIHFSYDYSFKIILRIKYGLQQLQRTLSDSCILFVYVKVSYQILKLLLTSNFIWK